jgi:hypothetical protein
MLGRASAGVIAASAPQDMWSDGGGSAHRTVYAYAADPEACVAGTEVVAAIQAELRPPARGGQESLDGLVADAHAWSQATGHRFRELSDRAIEGGDRAILMRGIVLGCAPLSVASGAWLQWLSSPGNADDHVALKILALYAADVGVGHPGASRGDAYLELLRRLRVSDNAAPMARLTRDHRIAEMSFRLPGLLLLMSRRPEEFRAHILGADLCLRSVGLLPPLTAVQRAMPKAVDWVAIDPAAGREVDVPASAELSRNAIDDLLAKEGPDAGAAVRTGFSWAFSLLRSWADALHRDVQASLEPAYAMAELMRHRAREGSVYHHHYQLEGRSLAAWLNDCRTDPGPLLDVLARSRLVKPGNSQSSSLVKGLISERGPMFRVFSPEDLTTIRRWIDSLAVPRPTGPAHPARGGADADDGGSATLARALRIGPLSGGRAPADVREAYHLLMNRTDTPALRAWSHDYVTSWLARCRYGMAAGPLPANWTAEGLRPWLQAQHDQHGAEFEHTAEEPLPSREAVIDDTLQTAPLTLIDGSWLQGFTDYELASSDIGHPLFETYWDELGNGEPKLNHPLIYRQVLAEMGIELPPTASVEFSKRPEIRDGSFQLPVYWLSVGRFPRTFLPEILGLNLAMELSGVGGTYRRARIALKTYGFNTRFVDIHNTIDNVATGHSAWAADAVDTYLTALPDSPGATGRTEAWNRVRAGYRSLNPPSGLGARLAARRAELVGRWRT